jgi:hypothetical protein
MPFSVITLAAAGADTGPFDLYSDDDSYAVAFETGVSKSSLLAGYYTFVPVGATVVRVKSASELCTNYVDMEITSTTTTTTTPAPIYNYYTFTPCGGGAGTDYRSILSLALNDVYAFQASPPDRACYTITSITAGVNSNNLPTIYGPKSDCNDDDCQQP